MNIEATGILIRLQKFQEDKYIASCFTKEHGIVSGIVRKNKSNHSLIPGNIGLMHWYARLEEQLGYLQFETQKHIGAILHHDFKKLQLLRSLLSLVHHFIKEREIYPSMFDALLWLLQQISSEDPYKRAVESYCCFELILLQEIGFGLDLTKCVVTHSHENLLYVSPKSGCAVSAEAGKAYHAKLLPLTNLLLHKSYDCSDYTEILQSLKLTGFFLLKAATELGKANCLTNRHELIQTLLQTSNA